MTGTLGFAKRQLKDPFARTVRGLQYSSLGLVDLPGAVPNPSLGRFIFLNKGTAPDEGADITNYGTATLVVQADCWRDEAMAAGIGLQTFGDAKDPDMGNFTHAINSSIDTFLQSDQGIALDPPDHTQAIVTLPNNYVTQKFEYDSVRKRLRVYANGALCDSRGLDLSGDSNPTLCPFIESQSDNTTIVDGQGYDARFKNMFAMLSNYLNVVGLPPYGSLGLTINGGGEITINMDGNGDASFDFQAQIFPCVCRFRVFDSANLGGTLRFLSVLRDVFGGDTFGSTRVTLASYPFSPKSITRLLGWYDGADLGTIATPIVTWPDKSGRGNDLHMSLASPRVAANAQGKTVAAFNGSGQLLISDALALALRTTGSVTICLAGSWTSGNRTKGLLSLAKDGSQGFNLSVDGAGNEQVLTGDGATTVSYQTGDLAPDDPSTHVVCIEIDAIRGTVRLWAYDGPPAPTDGQASEAVSNVRNVLWTTETPTFALGSFYCDAAGAGSALYGVGNLACVVAYDKILRDAERMQLIQYVETLYHK